MATSTSLRALEWGWSTLKKYLIWLTRTYATEPATATANSRICLSIFVYLLRTGRP
eukprot:m.185724 g.185724  ORF g.185724 m.185724 type:complete len:56 (+) comp15038_c0_seq1:2232-2399(+)